MINAGIKLKKRLDRMCGYNFRYIILHFEFYIWTSLWDNTQNHLISEELPFV